MKSTAQSEVSQLRSVYLKSVNEGFKDQDSINEQWRQLNYLDQPIFEQAIKEYQNFQNIIKQSGASIFYFEKDDSTGMDSIYCRDASILTDHGAVICNMGKGARLGEPAAQEKTFIHDGVKILGHIKAPGTIEGGDVAWLDEHTLAVGHGYRSNQAGFDQLTQLLSPLGITTIQVHLPHYKGPNDVFHLMSFFSPVDENLAVVYSPLMPVKFRNLLLNRGIQLIEVPDEEWESMGCNVLALAPRTCVIVAGNVITTSSLKSAGCEVYEYEGKNISVMGGGGPTCLTRPILRG